MEAVQPTHHPNNKIPKDTIQKKRVVTAQHHNSIKKIDR